MLRSWGTGVAIAGGVLSVFSVVGFLGFSSSFIEPLLRFAKPVAGAIRFDDVDSVGEPVEQGSGQPLTAHDLDPLFKG